MLLCVLLFLVAVNSVYSQSFIKTLPGFRGDLPFNLETGYVSVGENEDLQMFYYFVESERSPEEDPVLLWLTGGPGCSGFSGLVYEIGPLVFDYGNSIGNIPLLKSNPYSWTKVANIIFLDAPIGTGFSYANNWEGYVKTTDTSSASLNYDFLRKWLIAHPKYIKNSFYVAGDSYSGIIVPILVQKITIGNEFGSLPQINIQGYILGNPLTDSHRDVNTRIPFAYFKSLLSSSLYQSTKRNCKDEYITVDPSNTLCITDLQNVTECIEDINPANILEPKCTISSPKPTRSTIWDLTAITEDYFDAVFLNIPQQYIRPWCRSYNYISSYIWANDKTVQKALHVREGSVKEWVRCNWSLSYTSDVSSTLSYHKDLIKQGYRVLIYSGDIDMVVPYLATQRWIEFLNLTVIEGWKPWFSDGQVAGYSTEYAHKKYQLTYATVKGGGHTAPEYKPKECFAMIYRWLAYYPLISHY